MGDENQRRALLVMALGTGHPLLSQIDYTASANTFTVNLVSRLNDYGQIAPGQSALWVVLETLKDQVGFDKQTRIKALEGVVNGGANATPPTSTAAPNRVPMQPIAPTRAADDRVIVFISHKNAILENTILLELTNYLESEVESAGGIIWFDRVMEWGTSWDREIKLKLEQADIALLFISQGFLSSKYIKDFEIPAFMRRREAEGLVVLPLIIEHSTWKMHDWIREMLVLPDQLQEPKTIKAYRNADRADEIYLTITEKMVEFVKQIRTRKGLTP
jgi:hypothetical protein